MLMKKFPFIQSKYEILVQKKPTKKPNFFAWEDDRMTSVGSNYLGADPSTCDHLSLTPLMCGCHKWMDRLGNASQFQVEIKMLIQNNNDRNRWHMCVCYFISNFWINITGSCINYLQLNWLEINYLQLNWLFQPDFRAVILLLPYSEIKIHKFSTRLMR